MRTILALAAMLLPLSTAVGVAIGVAMGAMPGAALAQEPAERNVIAPYKFPPPAKPTDPLDRGRAELYRDQLRESLNRREQLDMQGKADILDRRETLELRGETRRMERALQR